MTALWLYYVEEFLVLEIGNTLDRSWLATKKLAEPGSKKAEAAPGPFSSPVPGAATCCRSTGIDRIREGPVNQPWFQDERAFGEPLRRECGRTQVLATAARSDLPRRPSRGPTAPRPSIRATHPVLLWSPVALAAAVVLAAIVVWRSDLLNGPRRASCDAARAGCAASSSGRYPGGRGYDQCALVAGLNGRAMCADQFLQELVAEQLAYLEHDVRVLASAMTGGSLDSILSLQPAARQPNRSRPTVAVKHGDSSLSRSGEGD